MKIIWQSAGEFANLKFMDGGYAAWIHIEEIKDCIIENIVVNLISSNCKFVYISGRASYYYYGLFIDHLLENNGEDVLTTWSEEPIPESAEVFSSLTRFHYNRIVLSIFDVSLQSECSIVSKMISALGENFDL